MLVVPIAPQKAGQLVSGGRKMRRQGHHCEERAILPARYDDGASAVSADRKLPKYAYMHHVPDASAAGRQPSFAATEPFFTVILRTAFSKITPYGSSIVGSE
jgi:hypothetical protein